MQDREWAMESITMSILPSQPHASFLTRFSQPFRLGQWLSLSCRAQRHLLLSTGLTLRLPTLPWSRILRMGPLSGQLPLLPRRSLLQSLVMGKDPTLPCGCQILLQTRRLPSPGFQILPQSPLCHSPGLEDLFWLPHQSSRQGCRALPLLPLELHWGFGVLLPLHFWLGRSAPSWGWTIPPPDCTPVVS